MHMQLYIRPRDRRRVQTLYGLFNCDEVFGEVADRDSSEFGTGRNCRTLEPAHQSAYRAGQAAGVTILNLEYPAPKTLVRNVIVGWRGLLIGRRLRESG